MKLKAADLAGVLAAVLLACVSTSRAQEQNEAIAIGHTVEIQSEILKHSRSLSISKPIGYEAGTERYPVIYVLDAESNFEFTAAITRFLAEEERIPEMIVVGIASGDQAQRTHDLTTPTSSQIENRFSPENGGAEAFLSFVSNELIPYIDRSYRTRQYKIVVGHSFGGLFALYALSTKPKLFNAYILIDPTVGWNNSAEIVRLETLFSHSKSLEADMFVTAANDLATEGPDIKQLAAVLEKHSPTGFRWRFRWLKDETHGSIPLLSVYLGLCSIFDGWYLTDPLSLYDFGGLQAIENHFQEGGKRAGYERITPAFTISILVAALIQRGRLDEASSVLLHDPKKYQPPWNQLDALARAYEKRGKKEQAIRYYRLSLKENPRNEFAQKKLTEYGVSSTEVPKKQ